MDLNPQPFVNRKMLHHCITAAALSFKHPGCFAYSCHLDNASDALPVCHPGCQPGNEGKWCDPWWLGRCSRSSWRSREPRASPSRSSSAAGEPQGPRVRWDRPSTLIWTNLKFLMRRILIGFAEKFVPRKNFFSLYAKLLIGSFCPLAAKIRFFIFKIKMPKTSERL